MSIFSSRRRLRRATLFFENREAVYNNLDQRYIPSVDVTSRSDIGASRSIGTFNRDRRNRAEKSRWLFMGCQHFQSFLPLRKLGPLIVKATFLVGSVTRSPLLIRASYSSTADPREVSCSSSPHLWLSWSDFPMAYGPY